MKLLLITFFVGFAAAAKLTGTYLPPSRAATSGGHGGFLQGPHASGVTAFGQSSFGGGAGRGIGSGTFGTTHGAGTFGTHTTAAFGTHAPLGGAGAHSGAYIPPVAHGGQYQQRTQSGPPIPILKYDNVNNGDGTYHFEYQTANGISQQEQGHLVNAGQEYEQVVQGTYSYTGDDGRTYTVHYKADGNGFQAVGDHLPTPPPIPEAIQKSLAYNAAHAGPSDSGAYTGTYSGAYTPTRPQQAYLPPSHTGVGGAGGYHY